MGSGGGKEKRPPLTRGLSSKARLGERPVLLRFLAFAVSPSVMTFGHATSLVRGRLLRPPCVKGAVERKRDWGIVGQLRIVDYRTTPPSALRAATSPYTGEAYFICIKKAPPWGSLYLVASAAEKAAQQLQQGSAVKVAEHFCDLLGLDSLLQEHRHYTLSAAPLQMQSLPEMGVGALRKHAGGMFLASDRGGYAAAASILVCTAQPPDNPSVSAPRCHLPLHRGGLYCFP